MSVLKRLKEYLDEKKIKYVKISHSPAIKISYSDFEKLVKPIVETFSE